MNKEDYLVELKKHGIQAGNKNINNLKRLYETYVIPKKKIKK